MTLETDVAPTVWVDESLMPIHASGEGALVGQIIPTGFEAYARILHPARRRTGDHYEPVTWAELARQRGKTMHPEVQLKALLEDEFREPPPWGELPEEDSIPEPLRAPLVDTLRRFTARDDRCWCCIWAGYGSWFGGVAFTRVDDDSPAAMRRDRREAERRAERERAILEAIPKASIMGGMRECLVFTRVDRRDPRTGDRRLVAHTELVVAGRSGVDRRERAGRTVDLRRGFGRAGAGHLRRAEARGRPQPSHPPLRLGRRPDQRPRRSLTGRDGLVDLRVPVDRQAETSHIRRTPDRLRGGPDAPGCAGRDVA